MNTYPLTQVVGYLGKVGKEKALQARSPKWNLYVHPQLNMGTLVGSRYLLGQITTSGEECSVNSRLVFYIKIYNRRVLEHI